MKKLVLNVIAAVLTVVGLSGIAMMSPAYAIRCANGQSVDKLQDCEEYKKVEGGDLELSSMLTTIVNVVIGLVGFVAVVMMIIGGISFITSQGDAAKVTKARNTILYGVVGLVVAMLAFAIVNFVLTNLG